MDDITGQLSKILSDPNSMAQIQNIMGSLGLGGASPTPAASQPAPAPAAASTMPDFSALAGLLGGNSNQGGSSTAMPGAEMIGTISRLAPLLGKIKEEDNSTRLLLALKPMLSEARRKKIDEAMRILQLMRLFPLLKDSGILSSLMGGLI